MSRFDLNKPDEIEKHLSSNGYLGGESPSEEDCNLLIKMKNAPNKATHPNFFHYYQALCMFKPEVMKTWKAEQVTKKAEKAEKKDEDDVDLFGDDDEDAEKEREARIEKIAKEQAAKKAAKGVVIAKSILVFDVKVYEMEQDLLALAEKVYKIEMPGLVWNKNPKLIEVAYGMKKLQVGCVVEDDKVLTDDLFDQILAWEDEVQSCDIVSMQKL